MIYEGAIIRRLVTPKHPGDPRLNDGNAFRTEYVLDDPQFLAQGIEAKTDQIAWTTKLEAAFAYPRHLDADLRAKQIGSPHCFARVLTAPAGFSFQDLSGGDKSQTEDHPAGEQRSEVAAPLTPRANGRTEYRGENRAGSGSDAPPTQNLLPADGRSTARAVKQRPDVHNTAGSAQSTSRKSRAAGKNLSKRTEARPDRLDVIREAAARTGARWWETGQYA